VEDTENEQKRHSAFEYTLAITIDFLYTSLRGLHGNLIVSDSRFFD